MEVTRLISDVAARDKPVLNFIGAGAYEHHIFAAVWHTTHGEFCTSYTPYQAEASQGTLQVVYEYQSMMTALTGMDVANASLYEGVSALAEAILMAMRISRKQRSAPKRVLMPRCVHPVYRAIARGIVRHQKLEVIEVPCRRQPRIRAYFAREQHIRRSKATSNICTNQGLMVTAVTIHLALLGSKGLERVAASCCDNAHRLAEELQRIAGVECAFDGDTFHERVLRLRRPVTQVLAALSTRHFRRISPGPRVPGARRLCIGLCDRDQIEASSQDVRKRIVASVAGSRRGINQFDRTDA